MDCLWCERTAPACKLKECETWARERKLVDAYGEQLIHACRTVLGDARRFKDKEPPAWSPQYHDAVAIAGILDFEEERVAEHAARRAHEVEIRSRRRR